MRIAAIVCARNEQHHIARCLDAFVRDGIDVVLIDHGSTDDTLAIARSCLGRGLLAIKSLPWHGTFALKEQLDLKEQITEEVDHDWIIHADADEWLCPPAPDTSLATAISCVDAAGFNSINFEEMVFVPWPQENFIGCDYIRQMTTYYYFAPSSMRLMRAWRRDLNAKNAHLAGHKLKAENLNCYPTPFILRHYIALSSAHAVAKYVGRRFSSDEIEKGWHHNRISIKPADLLLTPSPYLKQLAVWDSQEFDRSAPARKHYWQWPRT